MTEPNHPAPDETVEVSSSPESVMESPVAEGGNVLRAAAISTLLGAQSGTIRPLANELTALGFSDPIASGVRLWRDRQPLADFADLRDQASVRERDRLGAWIRLNEVETPEAALGFLLVLLGSELERESATAAAALWRELEGFPPLADPIEQFELARWSMRSSRWEWLSYPGFPWIWPSPESLIPEVEEEGSRAWNPGFWRDIYDEGLGGFGRTRSPAGEALVIYLLCQWRLRQALRSVDPVTRSLAMAAFQPGPPSEDGDDSGRSATPPPVAATPPGALVVSTMVHGTWGWKGDWWRPGTASFHQYVLQTHRPNLFNRGARFSWSGAYSESQRELAARDFQDWSRDVAPHGLQTVFAHSYGGEVAARAVSNGARVHELALLSVPATVAVKVGCSQPGLRVADVRLRFDPVLGLARKPQRLDAVPDVVVVILNAWRLDHGATHNQTVWETEDIANRAGL